MSYRSPFMSFGFCVDKNEIANSVLPGTPKAPVPSKEDADKALVELLKNLKNREMGKYVMQHTTTRFHVHPHGFLDKHASESMKHDIAQMRSRKSKTTTGHPHMPQVGIIGCQRRVRFAKKDQVRTFRVSALQEEVQT